MIVLGLETSTEVGGIALIDEGGLIAELSLSLPQNHSLRLLPSLDALLKLANMSLKEIGGIAISLGPGSFTGLRIGLSTAKGIALALEKPLVGVPTLDALALPFSYSPLLLCPMIDAKKGEVFTALYNGEGGRLHRLTPFYSLSPQGVIEKIGGEEALLIGNGAQLYQDLWQKALGEKVHLAPSSFNFPRASSIASLGGERLMRGERDDLHSLIPIYVRPSDAERKMAYSNPSTKAKKEALLMFSEKA